MSKDGNNSNKCPICGKPTHKESKYCIFHASVEEKTEEEFKKTLKEYVNKIKKEDGNYDFKGFIFVGQINLKEDLSINIFKEADFGGATFNGGADFEGATFNGIAFFMGSTFNGDAAFELKYLVEKLILSGIKVFPGKKLFIKINNNDWKRIIVFERAYLEDAYLDINIIPGVLIDFNDALLRNTKIERDQIENHILQEEKKEFTKAKQVYLLLKNNFHSIGKYDDESWAFKKEKDMERKSNCHFKTLHKWLWSCFLNGIFGYGIQPAKVIISAILIIALFAFLFMNPGISNVVGIEEITSNNFFDCVYFSTITFTTLGYGDFRPLEGWGRILAGSEAFIGAFMMALFVYTFARRTGGR